MYALVEPLDNPIASLCSLEIVFRSYFCAESVLTADCSTSADESPFRKGGPPRWKACGISFLLRLFLSYFFSVVPTLLNHDDLGFL